MMKLVILSCLLFKTMLCICVDFLSNLVTITAIDSSTRQHLKRDSFISTLEKERVLRHSIHIQIGEHEKKYKIETEKKGKSIKRSEKNEGGKRRKKNLCKSKKKVPISFT